MLACLVEICFHFIKYMQYDEIKAFFFSFLSFFAYLNTELWGKKKKKYYYVFSTHQTTFAYQGINNKLKGKFFKLKYKKETETQQVKHRAMKGSKISALTMQTNIYDMVGQGTSLQT